MQPAVFFSATVAGRGTHNLGRQTCLPDKLLEYSLSLPLLYNGYIYHIIRTHNVYIFEGLCVYEIFTRIKSPVAESAQRILFPNDRVRGLWPERLEPLAVFIITPSLPAFARRFLPNGFPLCC